MRMPSLWLLSFLAGLVVASAFAQAPVSASPDAMRVNPAVQRERDTTRMSILQDELATETRALETAQKDLRGVEALHSSADSVQQITQRVTLHRQNLSALQREIELAERPTDSAVRTVERRSPDDWLIPGRRLTATEQTATILPTRRRLVPANRVDDMLPAWIIPSDIAGTRP